jgi:curved DNA-binding protein CbpA
VSWLQYISHPAQGGNAEKFKLVAEAYSVLSDEVQRRQYDREQTARHTYSDDDDDDNGGDFHWNQRGKNSRQRQDSDDGWWS